MPILLIQKGDPWRPMEATKVHTPTPQRSGIPAETRLAQASLKYLLLPSLRGQQAIIISQEQKPKHNACLNAGNNSPSYPNPPSNSIITNMQPASKVYSTVKEIHVSLSVFWGGNPCPFSLSCRVSWDVKPALISPKEGHLLTRDDSTASSARPGSRSNITCQCGEMHVTTGKPDLKIPVGMPFLNFVFKAPN